MAGALRADLDPLSSAKFAYDSTLKVVSRFPAPLGPSLTSCKTQKIGNFFFGGQKIDFLGIFWGLLAGALKVGFDLL